MLIRHYSESATIRQVLNRPTTDTSAQVAEVIATARPAEPAPTRPVLSSPIKRLILSLMKFRPHAALADWGDRCVISLICPFLGLTPCVSASYTRLTYHVMRTFELVFLPTPPLRPVARHCLLSR
jgi:hypothetical protein